MTHDQDWLDEATAAFVAMHREEDVRTLALRFGKHNSINLPRALTQIEGWQKIKHKVPLWGDTEGLYYPLRLSLEQCSSQATAAYKAQLISGWTKATHAMADLTGGLGIDFSFLARTFDTAHYVERLPELCAAARHNFRLLGLHQAEVHEGDGIAWLQTQTDSLDLIYLDPARRATDGRKTVLPADCEPDLTRLLPLLLHLSPRVMAKLSPMLDLHAALRVLPHVSQVHIVAHEGECKELLLLFERQHTAPPVIHCTDLHHTFSFTFDEEQQAAPLYAHQLDTYLYEPHAALMKAGAFKTIAARFGLKKLHPNTHLYTSALFLPHFPGRAFHIDAMSAAGKKDVKALLGETKRANLTVRNFPSTVAELRKKWQLKEGGEDYLFATTLADNTKVVIRTSKAKATDTATTDE